MKNLISPNLRIPQPHPQYQQQRKIPGYQRTIFQFLLQKLKSLPTLTHLAYARAGSVSINKENEDIYYIEILLNLDSPFKHKTQIKELGTMVLFIHNKGLEELNYFTKNTKISYNHFTTNFNKNTSNAAELLLFNNIETIYRINRKPLPTSYIVTSIITQPFE